MARVTVASPRDIERVFKAQEQARRERVEGAIHEAAMLGAEVVAKGAPVDVGTLKSSIRARRTGAKESEIIADAPHSGIVEVGSRPHTPPLAPLIEWVKRHRAAFGLKPPRVLRPVRRRLYGAAAASRRRAEERAAAADAAVEQIARRIQRKIARYGTKPRWFMRQHLPKLRKILASLIRRRLRGT